MKNKYLGHITVSNDKYVCKSVHENSRWNWNVKNGNWWNVGRQLLLMTIIELSIA